MIVSSKNKVASFILSPLINPVFVYQLGSGRVTRRQATK